MGPDPSEHSIIRAGIAVRIGEADGKFYIGLGPANGKVPYGSLIDAKIKVLELIDTGKAATYLEKRRDKELARLRQRDEKKLPHG